LPLMIANSPPLPGRMAALLDKKEENHQFARKNLWRQNDITWADCGGL
jgi:hypothetical protein